MKKEEMLEELFTPIIEEEGLECVDVTFEKTGRDWVLTAYIDKEGGVDLNDCERVSRRLSTLLDEVDPIEQSYFLEVSSPGIDRPLKKEKDFLRQMGKRIVVNFYAPVNGTKQLAGTLVDYTGDTLTLKLDEEETAVFNLKDISKAALEIEF